MFGIIKKILIGLLSSIVNASNHTKCVSLSNQKCMIQPTLINLHTNEYNQNALFRSSHSEVFLRKCVLKTCSKWTPPGDCFWITRFGK